MRQLTSFARKLCSRKHRKENSGRDLRRRREDRKAVDEEVCAGVREISENCGLVRAAGQDASADVCSAWRHNHVTQRLSREAQGTLTRPACCTGLGGDVDACGTSNARSLRVMEVRM